MADILHIDFKDPWGLKKVYETYFVNTYTSSWHFLRHSARSCLVHSVSLTSKILNSYQKNSLKSIPIEEKCLLVWFQYGNYLSGPILSTIILSSFAIESFTRFCYTSLIKNKSSFESHLEEFDKKSASDRVERLIEEAQPNTNFSTSSFRDIKSLITFRNEIAHDDPLLFQKGGSLGQIKKGRKRTVNEQRIYPLLPTSNMPLSLHHATKASNTHDSLVKYILRSAQNENIDRFKKEIEHTAGLLILDHFPKNITLEIIDVLTKNWAKMEHELLTTDIKKLQDFMINQRRRTTLKVIE